MTNTATEKSKGWPWRIDRAKTLSIVGAGIVMLTFIVKDAMRERLRDLRDAIESTRTIYILRQDSADSSERLMREQLELLIPKPAKWTLTAGPTADLELQRSWHRVENVMASARLMLPLLKAVDAPDLTSLQLEPSQILNEWSAKYGAALEGMKKVTAQRLSGVSEKLLEESPGYRAITEALTFAEARWTAAKLLEEGTLKEGDFLRERLERRYEACSMASYFLYFVGWLLSLWGSLTGVRLTVE